MANLIGPMLLKAYAASNSDSVPSPSLDSTPPRDAMHTLIPMMLSGFASAISGNHDYSNNMSNFFAQEQQQRGAERLQSNQLSAEDVRQRRQGLLETKLENLRHEHAVALAQNEHVHAKELLEEQLKTSKELAQLHEAGDTARSTADNANRLSIANIGAGAERYAADQHLKAAGIHYSETGNPLIDQLLKREQARKVALAEALATYGAKNEKQLKQKSPTGYQNYLQTAAKIDLTPYAQESPDGTLKPLESPEQFYQRTTALGYPDATVNSALKGQSFWKDHPGFSPPQPPVTAPTGNGKSSRLSLLFDQMHPEAAAMIRMLSSIGPGIGQVGQDFNWLTSPPDSTGR